jgi:hypothetical protein
LAALCKFETLFPIGWKPEATVGRPSTSGSSTKAARACPPMWICLAPGTPPPICQRRGNACRRRGRPPIDQRLFKRQSRSFLQGKPRFSPVCNKSTLSGRRRSNPSPCVSSSNSVPSTPRLLGRRGPDSSMSAACACRSRLGLRFWPGASAPWRRARRPMPRPAGRSLLSLHRDARGLDAARTSPGSGAR